MSFPIDTLLTPANVLSLVVISYYNFLTLRQLYINKQQYNLQCTLKKSSLLTKRWQKKMLGLRLYNFLLYDLLVIHFEFIVIEIEPQELCWKICIWLYKIICVFFFLSTVRHFIFSPSYVMLIRQICHATKTLTKVNIVKSHKTTRILYSNQISKFPVARSNEIHIGRNGNEAWVKNELQL